MAELKYEHWNGYDFVYGDCSDGKIDIAEVIQAFPFDLDVGQCLAAAHCEGVGDIYIALPPGEFRFPHEVIDYVVSKLQSTLYDVYEFDSLRTFMNYATCGVRDRAVTLYMDKSKNKYYAKHIGMKLGNVADYATLLGKVDTLDFDKNVNLIEVGFKEEIRNEKENCGDTCNAFNGNLCVGMR